MTHRAGQPPARGAVLATVLLLCCVGRAAEAQISPGPLARAHASLEGAAACAQCHGLHREPMNQMCLACHKDIQWAIDQQRGFHARKASSPDVKCGSCHPDHAGADFALIAWPGGSREKFDHRETGFPLAGKHADTDCESCHTAQFRSSPAATLSQRKTGAGWMGLDPDCASCHRTDDAHNGSLGRACGDCHEATGWRPAARFDHATTKYPLTGRHADVACDKCHLATRLHIVPDAKGDRHPRFKPVPFAECSSCHADPHAGRLSPRCGDCHTTRGFGLIERKRFDHALTRFRLDGRHAAVACDACHGANLAIPRPAFATCAGCHADPHRGEATRKGVAVDCASCHSVQGFAPATFSVADHAATGFPLKGKHVPVKCAACHKSDSAAAAVPAPRYVRIRVNFAHCDNCHADAHGGQLAVRDDHGTCEACHSDAGWKPSTFTTAMHARLRVSLDGRHGAITCSACHGVTRPGLAPLRRADSAGPAHVILTGLETGCGGCHVDPHRGRYDAGGAVPMKDGCAACHDSRGFRPATVNVALHATFSSPLDGAHRATPCVACHEELKARPAASTLVRAARGVAALPFTATRATSCASCHQTPHGPQFIARADSGRCDACHGTDGFAPATRFNHDRDATFRLGGAHATVACASCHKATVVQGTTPITYRGTPATCEACHGRSTWRTSR